MNTTVHTPDLKSKLLANFKPAEGKPAALHSLRQEAIQHFDTLGFPTAKHEEWKYTDLKNLLKQDFPLPPPPAATPFSAEDLAAFTIQHPNANVLVFVNGVYQAELSTIVSPADVLTVTDFSSAQDIHADVVAQYFSKYAEFKSDAFTALNTAYAEHGAFIYVPANKVVEEPVFLYFIADASEQNVTAMPRNLFIAGRGSQVHIAETFHGRGSHASFTNIVTEVVVQDNARVNYYKLQNEGNAAYTIHTTQVHQSRDSYFSSTTVTLDGTLVRNNLNIVLDAPNCESYLYGLYLLDGSQHVDNHTLVDHAKPHSYSNELYKGILGGKSTGVFNGKIFVRKDAQKTNAFQSNRNILLSQNASMNTKPQLEIYADDVKCSHGATTGQLDKDMLFYLRARGIGEEKAKALLMYAFAADVIEHIAVDEVKQYVKAAISKRLPE
jgi:Fe-S cluster assembly protein SufD